MCGHKQLHNRLPDIQHEHRITGDLGSLVVAYLGFAHKEWHEDGSDAFFEDDGKDDAAGYVDQHHSHPHTSAVIHANTGGTNS